MKRTVDAASCRSRFVDSLDSRDERTSSLDEELPSRLERADASLDMHRVYRCPLIVIVPLRYRVFGQSITKRSTLKFDPIYL